MANRATGEKQQIKVDDLVSGEKVTTVVPFRRLSTTRAAAVAER